jgi:hypothetical protein
LNIIGVLSVVVQVSLRRKHRHFSFTVLSVFKNPTRGKREIALAQPLAREPRFYC